MLFSNYLRISPLSTRPHRRHCLAGLRNCESYQEQIAWVSGFWKQTSAQQHGFCGKFWSRFPNKRCAGRPWKHSLFQQGAACVYKGATAKPSWAAECSMRCILTVMCVCHVRGTGLEWSLAQHTICLQTSPG